MDESLIREQEAQLQKTGRYYKPICFMAVSYTHLDVYKRQGKYRIDRKGREPSWNAVIRAIRRMWKY